MGLKHDYRDYRNVKDLCHILNIHKKDFHLITNNPDKIKKFQDLGINLIGVVNMEYPPNPYNKKYLQSKQKTGH